MEDAVEDAGAMSGTDLMPSDVEILPPDGRLDPAARAELERALRALQSGRGLVVRLADLLGGMMGSATSLAVRGLRFAPGVQDKLRGVAEAALARAFDVAVVGLRRPSFPRRGRSLAGPLVTLSGAIGGFAGMSGFVPDATVTTLAIMREIAAIAREEGEDLGTEDARRACLEVFAFRVAEEEPPEAELSYFSARLMMQGRPLVLLLSEVASRYGIALSQKFAAQAVPVVGALCGAALNAAFLAHYRDLARAHFVIRRLERTHGREAVRLAVQESGANRRVG